MYNIGDYVNYSIHGICMIENIRMMKFSFEAYERKYYVLKPIYEKNAFVYVPFDNHRQVKKMRSVLSAEEIDRIILSVKKQGIPWINNWKQRMEKFNNILSQRNEKELMQLANCLYLKSKETAKRLAYTDRQIQKKVEMIIAQEFSFSLKISLKDVGIYIMRKLELIGV